MSKKHKEQLFTIKDFYHAAMQDNFGFMTFSEYHCRIYMKDRSVDCWTTGVFRINKGSGQEIESEDIPVYLKTGKLKPFLVTKHDLQDNIPYCRCSIYPEYNDEESKIKKLFSKKVYNDILQLLIDIPEIAGRKSAFLNILLNVFEDGRRRGINEIWQLEKILKQNNCKHPTLVFSPTRPIKCEDCNKEFAALEFEELFIKNRNERA